MTEPYPHEWVDEDPNPGPGGLFSWKIEDGKLWFKSGDAIWRQQSCYGQERNIMRQLIKLRDDRDYWQGLAKAHAAAVAAMREWIAQADHLASCGIAYSVGDHPGSPCTCGLDQLKGVAP